MLNTKGSGFDRQSGHYFTVLVVHGVVRDKSHFLLYSIIYSVISALLKLVIRKTIIIKLIHIAIKIIIRKNANNKITKTMKYDIL